MDKTENETRKHILRVCELIENCIVNLLERGIRHDCSKIETPEIEAFAEYSAKLSKVTYGSDEYRGYLREMKPAIEHHYAHNRHHPEHFKNGIDDMNLLDVLEMLCDWKAASERHSDGNIQKSIEMNRERFALSPQLVNILQNTIDIICRKMVTDGSPRLKAGGS